MQPQLLTSNVITPTVGRKVWYRPSKSDQMGPVPMQVTPGQPLDATVIAVWSDRCVNLLVIDMVGRAFPVLSATLVQPGDESPEYGRYAEWMPFQRGQANASQPVVETKVYADGVVATGAAPLPSDSPAKALTHWDALNKQWVEGQE